jgi:hypothetical protein
MLLAAVTPVLIGLRPALAEDVSAPVILQWFDASYKTIERRMADVFAAGYGAVWTPPPGRADSGNQSVGYDVYDRFDLGSAANPTLYGTETGIKQLSSTLHRAGVDFHVDYVINHNGFSDRGNSQFVASGGYPGFWLGTGSNDGDFHGPFERGDIRGRLAGLIDIDHRTNHRFVRNPVPGFNNVPAGVTPQGSRLANIASESNRRFYTDQSGPVKFLYDPIRNEHNIPVYDFNLANPMAGDPVEENAMGYLMRNAQWLVQVVGVDGLRIDAAKHVEGFALDFFDRAVYRANNRKLLDGSTKHVFSYSEVFDGSAQYLLSHVKKTINDNDPGTIGGNRDTLDFKLYFALKGNLENYGTSGAWANVKDASLDFANDGIRDGDAGVAFVGNHDTPAPHKLSTVAHAYTLMMPGNATVYFNGHEFGDASQRDFPKSGRGDALSVGGDGGALTTLVGLRNTHGRGNYKERVEGDGIFVFERESAAVVGLSNRGDGGFDEREVPVAFAPGTHLLEMTGNAASNTVDPYNDIREVETVYSRDGQSYVKVRVPRNFNANGVEHGRGYVVYGLPTPQAASGLELSNVSATLAGDTNITTDFQNGTKRQSDVRVLTGNSTRLRLQTNEVRLLGLNALRDVYADGDSAVFKVDGGLDFNNNGRVDNVTPNSVTYGFERFGGKSNPWIGSGGLSGARGDGEFYQDLDLTKLSEGYHFLEARAFRHRTDGGPAVFSEWKQTVYVDRLKPNSSIGGFGKYSSFAGDYDVQFKSDDLTADTMHVFLNLPANLTDAQVLAMTGDNNRAQQIDRDVFKYGYAGLPNGNNVFTIVTTEITGNKNVQRYVGLNPGDTRGRGVGDLNFDGAVTPGDLAGTDYGFEGVLYSRNAAFNPAADATADGLVDARDMFALEASLRLSATADVKSQMRQLVLRRGNISGDFGTTAYDIDLLFDRVGRTGDLWLEDLTVDSAVSAADVDALVRQVFQSQYGDANLDGAVNAADFVVLSNHFGKTGGWATADFNGDNLINAADFVILSNNFGYGAAVTAQEIAAVQAFGATVPEPAALGLTALAIPLLRRRRHARHPGATPRGAVCVNNDRTHRNPQKDPAQ